MLHSINHYAWKSKIVDIRYQTSQFNQHLSIHDMYLYKTYTYIIWIVYITNSFFFLLSFLFAVVNTPARENHASYCGHYL